MSGGVSIPTSSEEPVTPVGFELPTLFASSFNPHQLRRAGDTFRVCIGNLTLARFNPHQLRRAGDTFSILETFRVSYVSIPTSSEEPVIQSRDTPARACESVSIPTSSEEPVIPVKQYCCRFLGRVSIPTSSEEPVIPADSCTSPLPLVVSIPTSSEEPVILATATFAANVNEFQSPPAPKSR